MGLDVDFIQQKVADENDVIRESIRRFLLDVHTCIPAIIVSVNDDGTIDAQPTVQRAKRNDAGQLEYINYPLITSCPVIYAQGGDFIMMPPIQEGDEVLLHFAERCIDNWWLTGDISRPFEFRCHDLSDGFAQIGLNSKVSFIPSIDDEAFVIMKKDGSIYMKMTDTGISIKGAVVVDGSIEVNNSLKIGGDEVKNHKHGAGSYVAGSTPVKGDSGEL